jgi:hypothetical protein
MGTVLIRAHGMHQSSRVRLQSSHPSVLESSFHQGLELEISADLDVAPCSLLIKRLLIFEVGIKVRPRIMFSP